jgi:hypothetical protein
MWRAHEDEHGREGPNQHERSRPPNNVLLSPPPEAACDQAFDVAVRQFWRDVRADATEALE